MVAHAARARRPLSRYDETAASMVAHAARARRPLSRYDETAASMVAHAARVRRPLSRYLGLGGLGKMTHRWPPPSPNSDRDMYLGLGPRRLRDDSSLAATLLCIARTRSPQSRRTVCRAHVCAACDTAECARMRMVARRSRLRGKAGTCVHGACASAQQSWRQYRLVERNLPQQAAAEMLKM
jgi:hypothetical protein